MCRKWSWPAAANGVLRCERHSCLNAETGAPMPGKPYGKDTWKKYTTFCPKPGINPYKGTCDKNYCDKSGARQICQKMQVLHVNLMSRHAGILLVKRVSCGKDGQCSVFKSGMCIDLRKPLWSSPYNTKQASTVMTILDAKGGMTTQAHKFGEAATKLLKKHNNTLPEEHWCSDTRHQFVQQIKVPKNARNSGKGKRKGKTETSYSYRWQDMRTTHKDATLARFATLNF